METKTSSKPPVTVRRLTKQQLSDISKEIIREGPKRPSLVGTIPTALGGNKFDIRCVAHRKVHKNSRTFQAFVILVDTNLSKF